ncbi:hypothetical protein J2046_006465 [Rhizobium petrolearium]|nr:hypothetical protein [Neorhizobium petrolearium]MBP1848175.1 hypothetical protein [Neorhizobium petrolearium]
MKQLDQHPVIVSDVSETITGIVGDEGRRYDDFNTLGRQRGYGLFQIIDIEREMIDATAFQECFDVFPLARHRGSTFDLKDFEPGFAANEHCCLRAGQGETVLVLESKLISIPVKASLQVINDDTDMMKATDEICHVISWVLFFSFQIRFEPPSLWLRQQVPWRKWPPSSEFHAWRLVLHGPAA